MAVIAGLFVTVSATTNGAHVGVGFNGQIRLLVGEGMPWGFAVNLLALAAFIAMRGPQRVAGLAAGMLGGEKRSPAAPPPWSLPPG